MNLGGTAEVITPVLMINYWDRSFLFYLGSWPDRKTAGRIQGLVKPNKTRRLLHHIGAHVCLVSPASSHYSERTVRKRLTHLGKKGKHIMEQNIPYKIYLEEQEMPKQWYNVRADMKKKPAPILDPETLKPVTLEELSGIFCTELAKQELDDTTPYFDIPEEIQNFYKMYRPSPLVRAYCLEKKLDTPAHIYYKFEGNNTSGSHKLNSAIAQAYYAKQQGLKGVTTETGAGQWGTALSMACAYLDLDCQVYMVKCSYEQKPFRREVMRTYGAKVTPSPSMNTKIGQKINEQFPGTTGSLGCAISEAVEAAVTQYGYRYVLGSVLSQVLLHQSVIGLEAKTALDKYGIKADTIIGCAGGGSNLGGLISPFAGEILRGEANYDIIAVEPSSCPSLTRGVYAYDFCDTGKVCPLAKMYTLGSGLYIFS